MVNTRRPECQLSAEAAQKIHNHEGHEGKARVYFVNLRALCGNGLEDYSPRVYSSGTKFCSWIGGLTYLVLSKAGNLSFSGVRSP